MDRLIDIINKGYETLKDDQTGEVQTYIKKLAKVNPDLFGVSVCDVAGGVYHVGNTDYDFSIQSCGKPISYCMAREMYNEEFVHRHVGFEPSGGKFNAHILNSNGLPHNPMINAGAIIIAHLIKGDRKLSDCIEETMGYYKRLIGSSREYGAIGFDISVFLSEKEKSDRNRSLAYFMKEQGKAFTDDIKDSELSDILDFYYQNCSITINAVHGSIIAATLANGGVCPINGDRIFQENNVRDCCSLMKTCGMYDQSGTFFFKVGYPAKSGVSGVIFMVVPGKFGLCVFSPRTDDIGNSIRGVKMCHMLKNSGILEELNIDKTSEEIIVYRLMNAVASGILDNVIDLVDRKEADINETDYDSRSALHIAVTKMHWDIVEYLLDRGSNTDLVDVFGNTPFNCCSVDKIPENLIKKLSPKN